MVAELTTAVTPAALSRIEPALPTVTPEQIMRALNLDPKKPEVQALVLVCQRYDLDPLLKHALLINGNLYVTRDGLLHVAHRSNVFDGMEVEQLPESQTHYISRCSVYRRDMSRPFTFTGRYPKNGRLTAHGPEMADKVAACRALRHGFDVSLCSQEETWEQEQEEKEKQSAKQSPATAIPAVNASAYPAPANPARAPRPVAPSYDAAPVKPEPVTPPEAELLDEPEPVDPRPALIASFIEQCGRLNVGDMVRDNPGDAKANSKLVAAKMREILDLPKSAPVSPEDMADAIERLPRYAKEWLHGTGPNSGQEHKSEPITGGDAEAEPAVVTPPEAKRTSGRDKDSIPINSPMPMAEVRAKFSELATIRGFNMGSADDRKELIQEMYGDDIPRLEIAKDWILAFNALAGSDIKKRQEAANGADTLL